MMRFVGPTVLLAMVAGCAGATNATKQTTTEFYEDFRGKKMEDLAVRPSSAPAADFLKAEPEGLRITLPAGNIKHKETGIGSPVNPHGDFEITAGYEIIRVDPTNAGRGVSVEIYLKTNSPTSDALSFSRLIRPDGHDFYMGSQLTTDAKGKRTQPEGIKWTAASPEATGTSGQLRITRVKSEAILYASEGGKEFRELCRMPLGPDDVTRIRVGINPGGASTGADLRLTDLRVQGTLAPTGATVGVRRMSLWLMVGFFAALLVIAGMWFWWRKGRAVKVEERPPEEAPREQPPREETTPRISQ